MIYIDAMKPWESREASLTRRRRCPGMIGAFELDLPSSSWFADIGSGFRFLTEEAQRDRGHGDAVRQGAFIEGEPGRVDGPRGFP